MRTLHTGEEAFVAFLQDLRSRGFSVDRHVEERVRLILQDVRDHGSESLLRWSRQLDGMPDDVEDPEVPAEARREALSAINPESLRALRKAADRIRSFHERQKQESWLTVDDEGVLLGQMIHPLARVGIYVPGGSASYPSSVLMNAIPARVAGVREVVMCCPLSWSSPDKTVLAAAEVAGVDRIFRLGGAQAVAAMAYGVGGVPKVEKIVGPGNAYVANAKRMVFGDVDIDMIAGPSEIAIVADGTVPARWAAADLLSQAEHDEWSLSVLLTPSEPYALEVREMLLEEVERTQRSSIARASLERFGGIVVTRDLDEAMELVSEIAPEHLELLVARPLDHLQRIRNAGAVFLGPWSPEAMGDYMAGPNHVLPTGGRARFSSPLGVYDFVKRTSVLGIPQAALWRLGRDVCRIARLEGLDAHARSVECRLRDMERDDG